MKIDDVRLRASSRAICGGSQVRGHLSGCAGPGIRQVSKGWTEKLGIGIRCQDRIPRVLRHAYQLCVRARPFRGDVDLVPYLVILDLRSRVLYQRGQKVDEGLVGAAPIWIESRGRVASARQVVDAIGAATCVVRSRRI